MQHIKWIADFTASLFLNYSKDMIFILIIAFLLIIILIIFFIKKNGRKDKTNGNSTKYIITYNALLNPFLKASVYSNMVNGKFVVSEMYINKIVNDKNISDEIRMIGLDNIEFLKRRDILIKDNIDGNITAIISTAYKNGYRIIISGEKISKKLLKMFNVDIVDLSHLINITKNKYAKEQNVRFIITEMYDDHYKGNMVENVDVFITNFKNPEKNKVYDGKIDNIIMVDDKQKIILKDKHEEKD